MCFEWGSFCRTAFSFVIICRTHSTSEGWLWRQQLWGCLHIPREVARPPAMCVLPEGCFDRAKLRSIIATCFLLLVTVVETGMRKSWAVCTAVPNNDGVSSGQQVEWHGRTHSMIGSSNSNSEISHGGSRSGHFISRSFTVLGNIAGRGGGAGVVELVGFCKNKL